MQLKISNFYTERKMFGICNYNYIYYYNYDYYCYNNNSNYVCSSGKQMYIVDNLKNDLITIIIIIIK